MTKKPKGYEMSEEEWEGQVKEMAARFGWRYYHAWRSFHSTAGFPDCVMVRDSRVIYAELKAEGKQCSAEQYEWLLALHEAELAGKCEVYLWWPSDFDDIVGILR